jgi:hypothetical protein
VPCIIKWHAKRFKIKAYEEILVLLSMPYTTTQPGSWEDETVTHRCHAAPMHRRSWKLERADERIVHDEDSSNAIFCY